MPNRGRLHNASRRGLLPCRLGRSEPRRAHAAPCRQGWNKLLEAQGQTMMVTIRDVAGESGFSITTVSMVLNNGPAATRISGRTRTHIWKVAKRLGYRPNLFARSLRSRRSQTIGVVVFDITD